MYKKLSLPKSLKEEQREAKEAYLKERDAEKLGSKESEKTETKGRNQKSKTK